MFTGKGISLLKNNITNIFSTSIAKKALILSGVILGFYILFNLFAFIKLVDLADKELDKKIIHEIEHVDQFTDVINDTLFFFSNREFEEDDFLTITENAYFLQIYNSEGEILFKSPNMDIFGDIPVRFRLLDTDIKKDNLKIKDFDLRVVYRKLDNRNDVFIQLSTPRKSVATFIKEFEIYNLITLPVILLLIIIISFFLSKRVYLRLNKIIDLANEISAQNISKRIEFKAAKNDVYNRLKNTLNNLFDRLENQISLIAEFSNNASHQLMSPLTAVKTELEFILKKERSGTEYVETLNILKEQTEKMINIVQTLLLLARESDESRHSNKVFSLNKLIESEIKPRYINYSINYDIKESILLRGNSDFFCIALQNLLDNAVKYSGNDIKVGLEVLSYNSTVVIKVSDNGIGIAEEEKNKIFEKFYRSNNSKVLSVTGSGLGLSIVHAIIKQMNGSIEIKDNLPQGTVFILTFPKLQIDNG